MCLNLSTVFKMKFCEFRVIFVLCLISVLINAQHDLPQTPSLGIKSGYTKCTDDFNRPQRCIPEFVNAAYEVQMEATNTCGEFGPIDFCVQTGSSARKSCDTCREGDHPAYYLTDLSHQDNQTWWQSETMYENIQYPSQVNLTLKLRKAFDITYVRLWFYSPRPESFAIYKRTREGGPWIPYHYYSATCRDTYNLPDKNYAIRGEAETRALCTSEYSDISPLRGGNVAFSSLEGRPSAYNFDSSPELQEWVTATDIRITLDRLNTFGDEVFGDPQVLRSYFYAIADVAVGARCKCNGHASQCVPSTGPDGQRSRVCRCEHNTAGPDCGECLPFYNDAPWGRASSSDVHECKACNCNGFSERCYFDKNLYELTEHGGHCTDCRANRDGANCERCKENFYQVDEEYCGPCECDPIGSRSLQCNIEGKCQCKPGVAGDKCNRCDANYYDFSSQGCKSCDCSPAGSDSNFPSCNPISGVCNCKEHVEGQRCRECKPGYFNLDLENRFGCTPCFCYGHSSECSEALGYTKLTMESMFSRNNEKWKGVDQYNRNIPLQYNGITQSIGISTTPESTYDTIFFSAPDRFLGDQRASYNHKLSFTLRIGENGPSPSPQDVILEGGGSSVAIPIFAQHNQVPSIKTQEYTFILHEHQDYAWQPRLSARAFMSILANLTAIKIRGVYTPGGLGFIDDVRLETAYRGHGYPARWVENCKCPEAYIGQHCESCAPGYRHTPARGGPFTRCVPCECNSHTDICDPETGRCICKHNTAGDNCELCARGYYGNALGGSPYDCKLCPCPNNGACMQLPDETVVCLECPTGYSGPRCDLCSDGYFGDPDGIFGPSIQLCKQCDCNTNVDPNAVGNCNRTTGHCLKCVYNTAGDHCDQCLPGFYGDALALHKGDCIRCECNPYGTLETFEGPPKCDQITGQCICRSHVIGRNCDECEPGYFNLVSGDGCESCNCNPVGSVDHTCDKFTGQCRCRPGVVGKHCDMCATYQYGFSTSGCRECDCDPIGSRQLQCDASGQCPCNDNVEGRQCDRCKENKYDRKSGCVDCPHCYNLVQDAAQAHRRKLQDLEQILANITSNPTVITDEDFNKTMVYVQGNVTELLKQARVGAGGGDKTLVERLGELRNKLDSVNEYLETVDKLTLQSKDLADQSQVNVSRADENIDGADAELDEAFEYLNTEGASALERATERSETFGQQSSAMTDISSAAREIADRLQEEADEIEKLAKKGLNISTDAYDAAKNAIDTQTNITNDIRILQNELASLRSKLDEVSDIADESLERANTVYGDALSLLTEVEALPVPEIDVQKLNEEAQRVAEESDKIASDAESLNQDNIDALDKIQDDIKLTGDLIISANKQQNNIDALLSEADVAHTIAKTAVELGDETLKDAQQTLDTLLAFHGDVESSRLKAEEALKTEDDIYRMIEQAVAQTRNATESLEGARNNALKAKETAQDAQEKFALQASKDAEIIRRDANATKSEVVQHRGEADALAGRIAMTDKRLYDLEAQADGEALLASEAKQTIGEAKADAAEATKQVEKALGEVALIVKELTELPDINEKDLDTLEKALNISEEKLANSNLEERISDLNKARSTQTLWIKNREQEVIRLQQEVDVIRAIAESLPDACFKRSVLEPR